MSKEIQDEFDPNITAEKVHSQLLIKTNSGKVLEEAAKIIEGFGVRIVETKSLPSDWTLIKLSVKDMRDIAVKLSEDGFVFKGINALSTLCKEEETYD